MKKFFTWLTILTKRQLANPFFLALLIILPLTALISDNFSSKDNNNGYVAGLYIDGETDDIFADTVVNNLINANESIRFIKFNDVENMKEKIVYKIIHAPQNEVLLQTLPSIAYLDFAIVFYILFEIDEKGTATIPVTEDLLQVWETTLDEIHELAKLNTPKLLPAVFKPMRIVIDELMGNSCNNLIQSDDIMFVLTNSLRSFGAICILYEDVLFHIGNLLRENYYILPSSIHEVIIIPESQAPCKETLNEMITKINETQVEIEDVLSDHVYYYNREKKELLQH